MFKNKNENMNNVCGKRIAELRLALNPKCSQRQLAENCSFLDWIQTKCNSKNRMRKRFITDIEIVAFCKVFEIQPNDILLWYKIKSLI